MFLLLAAHLLIACSTKSESDKNDQNIIVFDQKENKPFKSLLQTNPFEITVLETTDQSLIGDFVQVLANTNNIYVRSLSDQSIYRFDQDGKFKNKIGSAGDGPEQYANISSFRVLKDKLKVLSNLGDETRIYEFNEEGEFLDYERIEGSHFYDFMDFEGNSFFSNGSNTMDSDEWRILKRKSNRSFSGVLELGMNRTMTIQELNFSRSKTKLFYHESMDPEIYVWTGSKFDKHLKMNFGKFNLIQEYFEDGDFYENYDKMMKNGIGIVRNYLESGQTQYINVVIQNDQNAKFFHLFLNKKSGQQKIFEAMSGRAPAFYFEGDKLVLMIHPADFKNYLSGKIEPIFSETKRRLNNLGSNDNPLLLKIDLSKLW